MEQVTIEQVISSLRNGINDNKAQGNDPDDISWGFQIGVLISQNQASAIIDALQKLK